MKQQSTVGAKPYDRCLTCAHRAEKRCDGPRTSAMELARWCEFMKAMKNVNGLTNAEVAERSGVSLKTIERIMAINCDQDIMRETARRIEDAIIGSSNQYPCYLAFEESVPDVSDELEDARRDLAEARREIERLRTDNDDYRKALDGIHSSYKTEIIAVRSDNDARKAEIRSQLMSVIDSQSAQIDRMQQSIDFLWAENNRKGKLIDAFFASRVVTDIGDQQKG